MPWRQVSLFQENHFFEPNLGPVLYIIKEWLHALTPKIENDSNYDILSYFYETLHLYYISHQISMEEIPRVYVLAN